MSFFSVLKKDNPLKNAPHTHTELAANEWKHKYDGETAAYPFTPLKSYKYWPPVAKIDNVYGEKIYSVLVLQWMNIKSRLKKFKLNLKDRQALQSNKVR